MNIEQAKKVPLALILEKIGYTATRERNNETVYFSPFRDEKTPSFHLNHVKNLWHDFGPGIGGNAIDFAVEYLHSTNNDNTVSDALRWLSNLSGNVPLSNPALGIRAEQKEPKLAVKNINALKHPALIGYLKKRGIPSTIAAAYLVELRVVNLESKKEFFAFGLLNEADGYEVRNPYLKSCAGTKAISFIRGKQPKPEGIHLFEGVMDYLSAITYKNLRQFDDDTIILNSLSCLKQALPYLKNYGYRVAFSWLDNDNAGKKGMKLLADFCKTEDNLRHRPMNEIYHPHKDVNAWHMHKRALSM